MECDVGPDDHSTTPNGTGRGRHFARLRVPRSLSGLAVRGPSKGMDGSPGAPVEPPVSLEDPRTDNQPNRPCPDGHAFGDVPSHRYRDWLLGGRGPLSRPTLVVAVSLFAVAIMRITGLPLQSYNTTPSSNLQPAFLPAQAPAPYYPYVINPSLFPTPGLLNGSGVFSLPKLSSGTSPTGLTVYDLLFVSTDGFGNANLSLSIGSYNATAAQAVFNTGRCSPNCSGGLPIQWGLPTLVHAFGKNAVTGDSLATNGNLVAAAATVSNLTYVYDSSNYGTPSSWGSAGGGVSFAGESPRLVVSACSIFLTTITSTNTRGSTIPLACAEPYAPPTPNFR